jgi:hypothetical protein
MEKMYKVSNLRVAVVLAGLGIDQSSSVEEILNHPQVELYALTDYFQAQNDEELDNGIFTFLIDIKDEIDWSGANMEGIHQD